MGRSTTLTVKDVGEVVISHSSGWHGDCTVQWGRIETPVYEMVGDKKYPREPRISYAHRVELPGELLRALAREAVLQEVQSKAIAFFEQLELDGES